MNTHKPLTTTGVRTTGIRGDGPSHRARHVAWMRERRWIAVGLAVAVVALAADMLLAGIGQLLGYTYTAAPDHDMLYWLCMFTMAVSAMASWSMFRFLICQGVSRRTIVTTQFAGNACIAAVVGVALTVVAAVDVLLIHLPAWQIFVGRAGMIARYPYALSWVPRYLSDEFGRTAVRMPGINWLILILAVFAFLMMAAMIGQFLGELAARLGGARRAHGIGGGIRRRTAVRACGAALCQRRCCSIAGIHDGRVSAWFRNGTGVCI